MKRDQPQRATSAFGREVINDRYGPIKTQLRLIAKEEKKCRSRANVKNIVYSKRLEWGGHMWRVNGKKMN